MWCGDVSLRCEDLIVVWCRDVCMCYGVEVCRVYCGLLLPESCLYYGLVKTVRVCFSNNVVWCRGLN